MDSFEAKLELLFYGAPWIFEGYSRRELARPKLLKSNALLAFCALLIIPQQSWVGLATTALKTTVLLTPELYNFSICNLSGHLYTLTRLRRNP